MNPPAPVTQTSCCDGGGGLVSPLPLALSIDGMAMNWWLLTTVVRSIEEVWMLDEIAS
jgi:hypothetical protein